MDEKTSGFLRTLLESGKTKDEARIELISQGYGSGGFDEAYASLSRELGISSEPALNRSTQSVSFSPSNIPRYAPLPNFQTFFIQTLSITAKSLPSCLGAIVVLAGVLVALSLVPNVPTMFISGPVFIALAALKVLLISAVSVVCFMALLYAVANAETGSNFMSGLIWSYGSLFKIIGLTVLLACILFTGFAALVLPGVTLLVYSIFTPIILARDGQTGISAVLRSIDLVNDYFWPLVLRLFPVVLVIAVVSVPSWIFVSDFSLLFPSFTATAITTTTMVALVLFGTTFFFAAVSFLFTERSRQQPFFELSQYRTVSLVLRGMALIGFVLPTAIVFLGGVTSINFFNQYIDVVPESTYRVPTTTDDTEQLDDFLIQSRLDSSYNATRFYYGRIQTYEGVCQDVPLEPPVECKSSADGFVLYAPLSTNEVYCRDYLGFKGYVDERPFFIACE